MLSQPHPLYEQVKLHVLERIADGTYRPGSKIPSENQLAAELGVSRLTAHRALRELTVSGALQRINGVGTFVAQPKASSTFVLLHNIADDIRNRGQVLSIQVHTLERKNATPEVAERMGIRSREPVFRSLIVYSANGSPLQLEDRYVSPKFAPAYLSQDFAKQSTTDYLQRIALPTRMEHEIQAVLPTAAEAGFLDLRESDPCLVVSRKTWVGPMVTTFTRFVHPGMRHSFVTQETIDERH
ncbi:GntR family histidine utilization transcriptional repressor [Rhizobium sp. WW_1]|nr:UTRA domain-containing protein [Rhizobium tropici]RKD56211.1 GntR family histidine utilization transcriptional repressor [Rhizobium sp. WW_1]